MEEALIGYLLSRASLVALVGSRIHWAVRPQGTPLPAVVLTRIDAVRDQTYAGRSGLVRSRVQVDCWGASYTSVKAVARQVVQHADAAPFNAVFIDDESDSFEPGPEAAGALHRTRLDLIIWHTEN
jgi:hypothetical protein